MYLLLSVGGSSYIWTSVISFVPLSCNARSGKTKQKYKNHKIFLLVGKQTKLSHYNWFIFAAIDTLLWCWYLSKIAECVLVWMSTGLIVTIVYCNQEPQKKWEVIFTNNCFPCKSLLSVGKIFISLSPQ